MRLAILLFFVFLVWEAGAQEIVGELKHIAATESARFGQKVRAEMATASKSPDVHYVRLNLFLNPDSSEFGGSVFYRGRMIEDGLPVLDVASNVTVTSLLINGLSISFAQDSFHLYPQTGAVKSGIDFTLEVHYRATIPSSRAFSRTPNSDTIRALWTLSQPYGAREWWPCFQQLSDKIDSLDVYITCPSQYVAVANGLLFSDSTDTLGNRHFSYRHRYPVAAYLVAVAVAPYEIREQTLTLPAGPLSFVNYTWPGFADTVAAQLSSFADIMSLFESLVGPYPFRNERYGHAQFGWGGGMEHQTLSFMFNFNFGLVAHELAHQWFGDKVTCGSWQDLWLNEGFATYFTGLAYEHLGKGNQWLNWRQQQISSITSEPDGSVFITDTMDVGRMFNQRLTYSKGAYLLHMARYLMGDSSFFAALREYLSDEVAAYGFARTPLLMHYFAKHGMPYTATFFDDWCYGFGYPQYTLEWTQHKGRLYMVLDQTPSTPWAARFFHMDVPVWVLGNGLDTVLRVRNDRPRQEFFIDTDNEVVDIIIDPDLWTLSTGNRVIKTELIPRANHFKIIPNPVGDMLQITFQEAELPDLPVRILSHSGQVVYEAVLNVGLSTRSISVGVANLPAGIYFVHLRDYYSAHYLKFVKG
jgi:aminopeptidase N